MAKFITLHRRVQIKRPVVIISLVILLVVLSFVAASGTMGSLETQIFKWMYFMSDGLRWYALAFTQFGNIWVCIGIIGVLFVVHKNPRLALLVMQNSIAVYLCVEILKFIVARPRPMLLLSDIYSREVAVFGYGFPSGHTALATVMSLTIISSLNNRWRWLLLLWIGLVAWSRIYLGVHAPLDVIGGFIVGLVVVLLSQNTSLRKTIKR